VENVCTVGEYELALRQAGFEQIEVQEVKGVFSGFASFLRRHQAQYALHIAPGEFTKLTVTAALLEAVGGHIQFVTATARKPHAR
jgi:hypothetical protein